MLCVIAKLDSASSERLAQIRRASERFGIEPRPLYGHITLACHICGDEARFVSSCGDILAHYAAFDVYYEKIEVLEATSIITASPRNEGALSDIHRDIASEFEAELDEWTKPGIWKPHTTLIYRPLTDLEPIAEAMNEVFTPFTARVETVEFSRVTDAGYEITGRVYLRKTASS